MAPTKKDTFFPGVRKALRLEDITPLANTAGEKRLKIDVSCSLADGKLVGIPEWLTGAVRIVQEVAMGQKKTVSEVELDGISLLIYEDDTSESASLDLVGVLAKGFVIQRTSTEKPSGEVADVELLFSMYTHWNSKLWAYAWDWFNSTRSCGFTSRQAKLTFGPAKKDGTPTAEPHTEEERLEAERKAATSKDQDHLFAAKPAEALKAAEGTKETPKPTIVGPRGFGQNRRTTTLQ